MNRLHLVSGVTGVGEISFKGILIGEKIATDILELTLEKEKEHKGKMPPYAMVD